MTKTSADKHEDYIHHVQNRISLNHHLELEATNTDTTEK